MFAMNPLVTQEAVLTDLLLTNKQNIEIGTILEVLTILAPSDSEEEEHYSRAELLRVKQMISFMKRHPNATEKAILKEARRIAETI